VLGWVVLASVHQHTQLVLHSVWTSVAAESESSDFRIRRSCRSLKNPVAQTLLTCLSRLWSEEMAAPRTCSLGMMVSSPRHRLGPQPSSSDRLCFVPVHSSSVLSALSFSRLADIQSSRLNDNIKDSISVRAAIVSC